MLAGDGSGKTQILNVEGKTTLKRLRGHKGAVTAAMFVPNSSKVVTGGKDKTLRVWDVPSTDELEQWEAHNVRAHAKMKSRLHNRNLFFGDS